MNIGCPRVMLQKSINVESLLPCIGCWKLVVLLKTTFDAVKLTGFGVPFFTVVLPPMLGTFTYTCCLACLACVTISNPFGATLHSLVCQLKRKACALGALVPFARCNSTPRGIG